MSTSLNWQIYGNSQLPALVLLHGFGANHKIWMSLIPYLTQDFCLYLTDLPGYGQNKSVHISSLPEQSEKIVQHAPDKAYWLGWSLGGLITTHIALMYPARVNGLITVASSPRFMMDTKWPGLSPEIVSRFMDNMLTQPSTTLTQFRALQTVGDSCKKAVSKHLTESALPLPDNNTLISGLRLLQESDLRSNLHQLNMPYLTILGENDAIVPVQTQLSLKFYAPNAHHIVMKQCAHAPFLSQPQIFSQHLYNFINKTA